MNKKRRLSPRSRAFHVVNGQLSRSELIAGDSVESEIVAEEFESAIAERNRILKEGITPKQKTESEPQAEVSKNIGHKFWSGILELAKVNPVKTKNILGSLDQKKIESLIELNASAKNPVDLMPLLPFLKNDKTDIQDAIDTVKTMQSFTPSPVQESEMEKIIAAIKIVKYLTPPPKPPSPEEVMSVVQPFFESLSKNSAKNMADFEAEITKIKLKRERDRVEILWKTYTNLPKKSDEDKLRFAEYLVTPIINKIESVIDAINTASERKLKSFRNSSYHRREKEDEKTKLNLIA